MEPVSRKTADRQAPNRCSLNKSVHCVTVHIAWSMVLNGACMSAFVEVTGAHHDGYLQAVPGRCEV